MNLAIFSVLLLVPITLCTSLPSGQDMACCIKNYQEFYGETAVFTCADDPAYCSQESCKSVSSNVNTIEVIDCTFSELPYDILGYGWWYISRLYIENIGLESINEDYFRSKSVYRVYASNNKLRSWGKGDYDHLEVLDLSKNEFDSIEGIAEAGLKSILKLNMSNNKISTVQAKELTGLKTLIELNLSFNLIETIPAGTFEKLGILKYLSLAANKLTTLEENSFPNLTALDLSDNLIESIESTKLRGQLQRLIVAGNRITALNDNTFNELAELTEIDLSANLIETIEPGTFWQLKQLKRLVLAHNRIVRFEFWDLPVSIEQIDVSFNGLQSLEVDSMTNMKSVQSFNVGSNNISMFSGFRYFILPKLTYVDLTRNNVPCAELKSALNSFASYKLEVEIQPNAELRNRSSYRGVQCIE